MTEAKPTTMEPRAAARVLREKLDAKAPVTVADAAAKSGLALRDAERGLQALTSEYRGQLRVTTDGDLVYRFPTGFTKPWETKDAVDRALAATGRAVVGVMRFLVRAWIMVVLVGYAALFFAILIAMTFAQQSGDNRDSRRSGGGELAFVLLRVLGDAFFWTWRPFSPMYYDPGYGYGYGYGGGYAPMQRARASNQPKVPFYERVNRFFFGPTPKPEDPRENERRIVAAIREGKGRIGLADVMRVTGHERGVADSMMARLMLDYDGEVDVSEDGGIVYRFPAIRRTANEGPEPAPDPAWSRAPSKLPPFTGNSAESNFLIVALNAFNLMMSGWCIANGMTLERIAWLFSRHAPYAHMPPPGDAIALGFVPLLFSLLLFVIPIARAVMRPIRAKKLAAERGRLAVLREVVERTRARKPIPDAALADAYAKAAGVRVDAKELTRELTALGGEVDLAQTGTDGARWRFVDLEAEAKAVEAERAQASEAEARLGKVVFATDES